MEICPMKETPLKAKAFAVLAFVKGQGELLAWLKDSPVHIEEIQYMGNADMVAEGASETHGRAASYRPRKKRRDRGAARALVTGLIMKAQAANGHKQPATIDVPASLKKLGLTPGQLKSMKTKRGTPEYSLKLALAQQARENA
jgi:hypothetical protein